MKMVSAAKLHKAQKVIAEMLPYAESLRRIMDTVLSAEGSYSTPLRAERPLRRVALVVFSANGSLAGAFNANIARLMNEAVEGYAGGPRVVIYAVGRKAAEAARKKGYDLAARFDEAAEKPDYASMAALAETLAAEFLAGKIDRAELIYHHFKSAGSQTLVRQTFLPVTLPPSTAPESAADYILEPSKEALLDALIPKTLKMTLYTALLDSNASEHAARVIAMQTATDNADELLGDLTLQYNKLRQQAITNELLDMAGGQLG